MSSQITYRDLFEALINTHSTSNLWSSRYESANLIIKDKFGIDIFNSAVKYVLNLHYFKIKKNGRNVVGTKAVLLSVILIGLTM